MGRSPWRAIKIKRPFVITYAAIAVVALLVGLVSSSISKRSISASSENLDRGFAIVNKETGEVMQSGGGYNENLPQESYWWSDEEWGQYNEALQGELLIEQEYNSGGDNCTVDDGRSYFNSGASYAYCDYCSNATIDNCYEGYVAAQNSSGRAAPGGSVGNNCLDYPTTYGNDRYFYHHQSQGDDSATSLQSCKSDCELACAGNGAKIDQCKAGCDAESNAENRSGQRNPPSGTSGRSNLAGQTMSPSQLLQMLRQGGSAGAGGGLPGTTGGLPGGTTAPLSAANPAIFAQNFGCSDNGTYIQLLSPNGFSPAMPQFLKKMCCAQANQTAGQAVPNSTLNCNNTQSVNFFCNSNGRLWYQTAQCNGQCNSTVGDCSNGYSGVGTGTGAGGEYLPGAQCINNGKQVLMPDGVSYVNNPQCLNNTLFEFQCTQNGVYVKTSPCPQGCGNNTCLGNSSWQPWGSNQSGYPGYSGSGGYYNQQQQPWWQQIFSQIMPMLFGWIQNVFGGGGSSGGYSSGGYSSGGYSYTGGGATPTPITIYVTPTPAPVITTTTTGGANPTTTTTTTSGTTATQCTDSDGGFNINERGYVNQPGYGWDQCVSDVRILENYCDENGNPIRMIDLCPYGCFDGACKPAPVTATVTSTRTCTSPNCTPTATPTQVTCDAKREVKHGFNAVEFSDKYKTKTFIDADMTVFEYLFNPDKNWLQSGKDKIDSFFPDIGYYIYNPGPDRDICLQKSTGDVPDITLQQSWNFLANSSDSARGLSEIKIHAPGSAGEISLSQLFQGTGATMRAYYKIFVIKDPYTGDASKAYETITVSADNVGSVKIPAGKTYWVYLFE